MLVVSSCRRVVVFAGPGQGCGFFVRVRPFFCCNGRDDEWRALFQAFVVVRPQKQESPAAQSWIVNFAAHLSASAFFDRHSPQKRKKKPSAQHTTPSRTPPALPSHAWKQHCTGNSRLPPPSSRSQAVAIKLALQSRRAAHRGVLWTPFSRFQASATQHVPAWNPEGAQSTISKSSRMRRA